MRWLVDEGVPRSLVAWLRARGDDALYVTDSSYVSSPDRRLCELAAAESRVILTKDLGFLWPSAQPQPLGLVLFRVPPDWNARQITMLLTDTLGDTAPDALFGQVTVVEPGRVRQRALRDTTQ